jgi:hypothetical protein
MIDKWIFQRKNLGHNFCGKIFEQRNILAGFFEKNIYEGQRKCATDVKLDIGIKF